MIWTEDFPCPAELTGYYADRALQKMGVKRLRGVKLKKPDIEWTKKLKHNSKHL